MQEADAPTQEADAPMQADTPTAIPAEAPNARAAESAAAYQRSLERARQQAEDAASGKLGNGNGGGGRRENRPAQSQADLPLNPPEPEGGKADPSQEQSRTERDSGS